MPVPIVYRSLKTIHDTIQNTTDLNGNSTARMQHSHNRLLSGLVIATNILLIILIYLCFYKYFFHKRSNTSNSHHHSTATTGTPGSSPPCSPRTGPALDPHVVSLIPVAEFKSNGAEKSECVVCLAEFKDGDKVSVLPQCSHQFHVDCVDIWFQSHANCPLCRTLVQENAGAGSESMV